MVGEVANLAYHYLTMGKSEAEQAAFDLVLAGEEDPQAKGQANRKAMESLGMIGAVPARKKGD